MNKEHPLKRILSIKAKIKNELKNKTILITGGGGSIGSVLTKKILDYPVKSVRILDTNEHSLFKLKHSLNDSRLRLLLGNILDQERVEMACNDVDIIFHAAAIKNIEISEFNPIETIDTNVNGLANLIKVTYRTKPQKFLNISTDKAVNPSTLYGTTKQLSERLTSWAGMHGQKTKYATVRLGNVFESQGNVFEIWNEQFSKNEEISITHPLMKRYFFHAEEAANFILDCLEFINKGEIFVPKMKLYEMQKLADDISKKQKVIGIRRGEKVLESLLSEEEEKHSIKKKNMWIIKPYH